MDVSYNIFDTLPHDCWVTIDSQQLTENVRCLQKTVGLPVLAAIKANGYGHGYERAARAFLKGGATYLGVASLSEGLLLQRLGFTCPILIMCGMLPAEIKLAAEAGLEFFVWRPDHIAALQDLADSFAPIRVHLKIDTGMGRAGCHAAEAVAFARALKDIQGLVLQGLATHFASADIEGIPNTLQQIAKFEIARVAMRAAGLCPPIIHAANSAGALYFPEARYNMVRFGIAAYGIPPEEGLKIPEGVKPALTWHTRITSTKIMAVGQGISYGSEYKMKTEGRIGVLPVGYADGFRRSPKGVNTVLIEGQERKTLGRICMDQCMVDLGGFEDITGAEVILIGKQGNQQLTAENLARHWQTNPYDVCTGIATRVPRREAV